MLTIPVHVAASGFEMLVWLIVGIIWLIFQGLASAAKKKAPPDEEEDEHPTLRPMPPRREEAPGDELRDLLETLTGRKPPIQTDEEEGEEPPALPRPAPKPVLVRKVVLPPPRVVQPLHRTARPAAVPPPVPQPAPLPEPVMDARMVFAQAAMTRESLRLAPLMKMTWPRSQFQRLGGAARRTSSAAKLKQQLIGQAALRQAMVSRIVLGPPGGR